MRILLALRRPGLMRHYGDLVELLLARGHEVEVAFSRVLDPDESPEELAITEAIAARHERLVTTLVAGRDPADGWRGIARVTRFFGDYLRYLHPRFADAPLLRERIAERLLKALSPATPTARSVRVAAGAIRLLEGRASRHLSDAALAVLRVVEDGIPPSESLTRWMSSRAPDVVVVAPLVERGSEQAEFIKSARALGIPSVLSVTSWDNLSSKGLIRPLPDRTIVWNETQAGEATAMHRVPRSTVVITGAHRFDPWFGRRPSLGAEAFKEKVGLPADVPYVLYLCSSSFIAPAEKAFVDRWIRAIRASNDAAIHHLGVLVRPHPKNLSEWRTGELDAPLARVWPRTETTLTDEESRADFFDSLAHACVIVGANTSALIEAAIVGKTVLTVADGTFPGQDGTLHYRYLLTTHGGFVREARTLTEHLGHLHDAVTHDGTDPGAAAFVRRFVRPRGIDVAVTPILADEIERAAAIAAGQRRISVGSTLARAALAPFAGRSRARQRTAHRARKRRPARR